ncbi:MAG: hypothetical protein MRERC_2c043 [Mycoplasmataceae bacterium RC_NB112A]|nr:MAG: hypothetical protein MRERC_2c043 [Mycoplasmataceae bacterium RC_NB112A]
MRNLFIGKKEHFLVCSLNPADTLLVDSEFVKMYLQGLINRGYEIRDVENKVPWKLEKSNIKSVVEERINKLETMLKNDKTVSAKVKQELLENLRKMGGIKAR